jgi:lactaldehyde reductase
VLAAVFAFVLHRTNFGRRTYAIGNNPTGAWYSGINVKRHNLILFALVGLMSGLASVLLTSRLGSTRPTIAMGWELAVVTMAVLGGVNILGGSGSMVGVIIAAFLMGLVTFGLSLLNVPGIVMSVIIGAMLIVVISLPIITRRMMQRRRICISHESKSILRRIIMSFMLALPKISLHGAGAIGDMVNLVANKQWGKALIVTDGQLVKLGLLDSLFSALDAHQMSYHLFDEVFPNPTEALVQKGFAAYQDAECDYVIAFGGGSPIDTAKAIKILTANPGPSTAYSGVGKVKNAGVPLVAINTTAGTAAEMTSNAVIIDSARQVKEVIIDPNIIPDIAVDDASVMLDIPASVTAATGMDALTHAIEAYVSVGAHPLTDANALEAIRLINLWLPKAVDDGHNLEAREQMAFGQYLAGMAFNSAGLGLVHALAHQPGATHNLPHGVCNAILLPIIENFNRPNAVARFARVAQAMGVDTRGMSDEAASMSAIQAIRDLSTRVGIPWFQPAWRDQSGYRRLAG